MNSELLELKTKVNAMEQRNLNNVVAIRGIDKGIDPTQMVQKIATIADLEIEGTVEIHSNAIADKQVIIAKFNDMDIKTKFIKSAKKKKITTNTLGLTGTPSPVYVDEQLTKDTYQLLARAKQLKKIGYKFIWVSNGEILIRENDEAKVTKITSAHQITELEKKHALTTAETRRKNPQKLTRQNTRATTSKKNITRHKKPNATDATSEDDEFTDAETNY